MNKTDLDLNKQALELHEKNQGKIEVVSKVKIDSREVLSRVYTPGVADVCRQIEKHPDTARDYTMKGRTVAIITDGSAVLGLGNIGPLAALPVMEGKAAIFKEFAGVDAFPICLNTQDEDEIIKAVKQIAPVFGGINLEDIAAPRCFNVEEKLRAELDIPVLHDDQWGAATVTLAALINSLKLADLDKNVKVVLNGVGAAGVATGRLLLQHGIKNIVFCDSRGIITRNRTDLTSQKRELVDGSVADPNAGALVDAIVGADVFIGLSKPNLLTADMVKTMNKKPIIFALANPDPEIRPDVAKSAGAFIVATGRSDFPNQINNALVFPGLFKGMLDARLEQFDNKLFEYVAEDLASHVTNLSQENILPDIFDSSVVTVVSESVRLHN